MGVGISRLFSPEYLRSNPYALQAIMLSTLTSRLPCGRCCSLYGVREYGIRHLLRTGHSVVGSLLALSLGLPRSLLVDTTHPSCCAAHGRQMPGQLSGRFQKYLPETCSRGTEDKPGRCFSCCGGMHRSSGVLVFAGRALPCGIITNVVCHSLFCCLHDLG